MKFIIVTSISYSLLTCYYSHAMIILNSTNESNGLISLTQIIDSLEQLKGIAPIFVKTCKTKNNSSKKTDRYDFSRINVRISPKVFDQYIKEKNFMGEHPSPSLLNRILCHSSNRENQLRIAQQNIPHQYKEWSEMLIKIYGNQQKILARDENSIIDYNTFQDEKKEKKDMGEYNRDNKKQKQNLDHDDYSKDLSLQLDELNKKNESLSTELQLNNLLTHFIIAQQQKEDNTVRWKEKLLQIILVVATGLGTYYGSANC